MHSLRPNFCFATIGNADSAAKAVLTTHAHMAQDENTVAKLDIILLYIGTSKNCRWHERRVKRGRRKMLIQ